MCVCVCVCIHTHIGLGVNRLTRGRAREVRVRFSPSAGQRSYRRGAAEIPAGVSVTGVLVWSGDAVL